MHILTACFAIVLSLSSTVAAGSKGGQETAWIDPIIEITIDTTATKEALFEKSSHDKPLALHSAQEAGEYFSADDLAKLDMDVDFSQQCLLVFAWRGSGQDKLDYSVAESFPEQVAFAYQPGRTRDLRPHVKVFAVRANVNWSVRGGAASDDETRLAHYLNADGELRFPVTLRDSQSGFAGETGFLWTIDCDGAWQRQSFINETVRDADQEGQLTKEQLQTLGEALAKADMVGLTPSTGQTGVNPHIVTVTYGKKQATVILHPGQPLPESDETKLRDPVQRISYLTKVMQTLMQPE